MPRRLLPLTLAAVIAAPLWAQDSSRPLSASEFEALTTGHVMSHAEKGSIYGAEEYLPGRRVIWKDADGCLSGHWQESGGLICFDYEGSSERWCWSYVQQGEGLVARLMGDAKAPPVELRPTLAPLSCPAEMPAA